MEINNLDNIWRFVWNSSRLEAVKRDLLNKNTELEHLDKSNVFDYDQLR